MIVGFDYGSANCAVGVLLNDTVDLLTLEANSPYITSTLYAYDRDLIAEAVYQNLPQELKAEFAQQRSAQLSRAKMVRLELDLLPNEKVVFFGNEALNAYLEMPEEGFYVRSPKSFLGATGLRAEQIALFEDIVTLMMQNIRQQAQIALAAKGNQQQITKAVIGRPVNFQGIGGEKSNQQAEAILSVAALRAGFLNVQFLFEPLAAALDFETTLKDNKTVLVVDVGGGTTDCSMVKMGPSHINKLQRSGDFLGHAGQRIGGNDLDIALAMQGFMPKLGSESILVTGKPVPNQPFWNAVAVNDLGAQRDFYSLTCKKLIEDLIKDATETNLLQRLLKVQQHQLSYQLVRTAEKAKIGLSEKEKVNAELDFIESQLTAEVTEQIFKTAIDSSLQKVQQLMLSAVEQADVLPDLIYVTGGTAKCSAVFERIKAVFPDKKVIIGDYFGSVTAGLTHWASRVL